MSKNLIIVTGVASYAKADFTEHLAQHALASGQSVTIIDQSEQKNSAPIDGVTYQPQADTLNDGTTLFNTAESLHPDAMLAVVDDLYGKYPALEVKVLAVVDEKTCDCFPNLRRILEDYADFAVRYPLDDDAITEAIAQVEAIGATA